VFEVISEAELARIQPPQKSEPAAAK